MTDDPLWRFSLALYARPDVAAARVALQDEAQADVTLLLYLLWCAATGRPCDAVANAAADARLAPWRAAVIIPLRDVRRFMMGNLTPGIGTEERREHVKAAEREADTDGTRMRDTGWTRIAETV